jgi:4-amino-4-deoxy-L-arabinose transferase-like glycosyltransferase
MVETPLPASLRLDTLRGLLDRPRVWAAVVTMAALGVLGLHAWAIRAQSFTTDEPYHLLAGYQALRYGTNTLNLEHPPLVKLVAALPLLAAKERLAPPTAVANAQPGAAALFTVPGFVGVWRLSAKTVCAGVFGGLLLWGCYLLGCEVGGRAAGLALALLVTSSFALLPHFSVVQSDVAATAGFVLTLAAALAFVRRPAPGKALAMGAALGLALAAKFSGVLLLPTVLAALALAARRRPPPRRLAAAALAVAVGALAVPCLSYAAANASYDLGQGEAALRAYCEGRSTTLVGDRLRPWEGKLLALGRRTPGAAQWLTGLLAVRAQNALASYSFVSFGETRSRGRWWYHPALFLIKTPLAILVALAAAVFSPLARSRSRPSANGPEGTFSGVGRSSARTPASGPAGTAAGWLVAVTAGVYLAAALSSNYNIGSRHLMPIVPLLYLPAAVWLAESRWRTLAVAAVLLGESAALGPYWLQATNTWWLGRWNPSRFASITGDYEWKQNFIALAAEAKRRQIRQLHVVLVGTDAREIAAYLPGGDTRAPGDPLDPGWYAVSIAVEQSIAAFDRASPHELNDYALMAQAAGRWRALVATVEKGEDHGIAGGTFRLVYLARSTGPGAR